MTEVPDKQENLERCNCPACPSNPDDDQPGLYCARGVSDVRVETTGCLCTTCPIYRQYDLSDGYFCAVVPEMWDRARR